MALVAVRSKAAVLLLLIHCLVLLQLFWSLLCYAVLSVFSSFAIILMRKRELVALLKLSSCCLVTVCVMWLFLMVSWVGMQCMTVVIPGHTYLPYCFNMFQRL